MAMKANYVVPYRRKRQGKTNYKKRLALLLSNKHRIVVRRSLNNTQLQIIKYEPAGDKIIVSASTQELKKQGWAKHTGNIPAAYLCGLLLAKKAKDIKEAILDIGLNNPIKGSRIYAALKGMHDGGLNIPLSEAVFPKEDRINGSHISDEVKSHFEEIKKKIQG